MALSDLAIRNAKPGKTVRKLSDGQGLQLWIMPNGSKLWRLAYRFGGKQKKLSIGPYPEIGLAGDSGARDAAAKARAQLRAGVDPSAAKQEARRAQGASIGDVFRDVAADLRAKKVREGRAPATLAKTDWLLEFAMPTLGSRPVAEITPQEILAVLRTVEARGRHESARRLRSVIGEVFRFAIATARAGTDPTFALRGALAAPQVKHRAALTDWQALGGLMRAIEGFDGQMTTTAALKLMAFLVPRPGELRLAQWDEFDLAAGVWTIPASRTKMRRPHRIPLPSQARALLASLRSASQGDLVFQGYGVGSRAGLQVKPRPISENTMNAALRRMGYGPDEMTVHGFRASFSTLANESSLWNRDAIERQLAHVESDDVRRAYARSEHWEERVRMMQWWADQLCTFQCS